MNTYLSFLHNLVIHKICSLKITIKYCKNQSIIPLYDLLQAEDKNVGAYITNFLDDSMPLGYNTVSLGKQLLMFPRDAVSLSSRI
jgi:hypothetical protein